MPDENDVAPEPEPLQAELPLPADESPVAEEVAEVEPDETSAAEESPEPEETPEDAEEAPLTEEPEVAEETPEPEEAPADEEAVEAQPEEVAEGEEAAEAQPEEAVEAVPEPETAPELEPESKTGGVSWVPFSVYLLAWVVLAVGTVVVLRDAALAGGALWAEEYVYTVYGGIGLAAAGPVLALIVWLMTRTRRSAEDREGLFVSSLLLGAGMTFLGTILWLVALYVLDLYRIGVLS